MGKKSINIPPLKYKENNIEKNAKTDEEKANVFTHNLVKTCSINDIENQQYYKDTENRVKETLTRNIHKITPKHTINLQSIRDPRTNFLPFDNLDIIN